MSHVEQIKEKLTIVDVVGTYLKLEKTGANFKALCPFHHEKTPSFFISPSRNSFYCFGCGQKGDIFSFVQEFEGLDFLGSLKVLAEKAGVKLVHENFEAKGEKDRLYSCLELAALFFEENLLNKQENAGVIAYLTDRGLSIETIKEWGVGYALPQWHSIHNYLKGKKFTDEEIEKVGLIKKAEERGEETRFYDRFRGRITFPIRDSGGRTIGFSGRILVDDGKSAKYLNSPETLLFSKSKVLFGLDKAKSAIRDKDEIVLVEGQMDIILAHQAGTKNTVALSGTALTEDHIELLHRFSNRIIFAFDPDRAGISATRRSAIIALRGGMDVRVVSLPKGEDPADLIRNRKEEWFGLISKATHIIYFSLEKILQSGQSGKKLISEISEQVFPFMYPLQSSMEKSHFIREISKKTGISEEAIVGDYKKAEKTYEETTDPEKPVPSKSNENHPEKSHRYIIERRIYGIMQWQENAAKSVLNPKMIGDRLTTIIGEENFKKLKEALESSKNELALKAEILYRTQNTDQDLEELFMHLEQDYLKEKLAVEIEKLGAAERVNDKNLTNEILKKCRELTHQISELRIK